MFLRGTANTWLVLLTAAALFAVLLAPACGTAAYAVIAILPPDEPLLAGPCRVGITWLTPPPRIIGRSLATAPSRAPPA